MDEGAIPIVAQSWTYYSSSDEENCASAGSY